MTTTACLTAAIGVVYLWIGIAHFAAGRIGLGITFTAYALANAGLVLAERGR